MKSRIDKMTESGLVKGLKKTLKLVKYSKHLVNGPSVTGIIQLTGSGEKYRRYVEKTYVISIKSLVFFTTLTHL